MMHSCGEVREEKGQWLMHWEGLDTKVSKEDAEALRKQEMLKVKTSTLTGTPLDWATAVALNYTPTLQAQNTSGKILPGGIINRDYCSYYVVAYFGGRTHYGEFNPSVNPVRSSPIFDSQRISTEVAGDGWAALINDCFGPSTWSKSVKAPTRILAGLRCLVDHILGPVVEIPADLLSPEIRLAALRTAAIA